MSVSSSWKFCLTMFISSLLNHHTSTNVHYHSQNYYKIYLAKIPNTFLNNKNQIFTARFLLKSHFFGLNYSYSILPWSSFSSHFQENKDKCFHDEWKPLFFLRSLFLGTHPNRLCSHLDTNHTQVLSQLLV